MSLHGVYEADRDMMPIDLIIRMIRLFKEGGIVRAASCKYVKIRVEDGGFEPPTF